MLRSEKITMIAMRYDLPNARYGLLKYLYDAEARRL